MKESKIEMTCVVDAGVGMKLPVVELEDMLNEHIKLSDYGTGIEKILFVFIAVSPGNTIHEPHIIHTESEAHLEIALKLDYAQVVEAEGDALMGMLQGIFLKGLGLCNETNLAEFRWLDFLNDTKKILHQ